MVLGPLSLATSDTLHTLLLLLLLLLAILQLLFHFCGSCGVVEFVVCPHSVFHSFLVIDCTHTIQEHYWCQAAMFFCTFHCS